MFHLSRKQLASDFGIFLDRRRVGRQEGARRGRQDGARRGCQANREGGSVGCRRRCRAYRVGSVGRRMRCRAERVGSGAERVGSGAERVGGGLCAWCRCFVSRVRGWGQSIRRDRGQEEKAHIHCDEDRVRRKPLCRIRGRLPYCEQALVQETELEEFLKGITPRVPDAQSSLVIMKQIFGVLIEDLREQLVWQFLVPVLLVVAHRLLVLALRIRVADGGGQRCGQGERRVVGVNLAMALRRELV